MTREFLHALWSEPWWRFDPQTAGVWSYLYCGFNLIEGFVWIVFSILVLRRSLKNHLTRLELVYAATFLVFGLTDFREAMIESAPLVLVKGIVLLLLFSLRKRVIKTLYPQAWY